VRLGLLGEFGQDRRAATGARRGGDAVMKRGLWSARLVSSAELLNVFKAHALTALIPLELTGDRRHRHRVLWVRARIEHGVLARNIEIVGPIRLDITKSWGCIGWGADPGIKTPRHLPCATA